MAKNFSSASRSTVMALICSAKCWCGDASSSQSRNRALADMVAAREFGKRSTARPSPSGLGLLRVSEFWGLAHALPTLSAPDCGPLRCGCGLDRAPHPPIRPTQQSSTFRCWVGARLARSAHMLPRLAPPRRLSHWREQRQKLALRIREGHASIRWRVVMVPSGRWTGDGYPDPLGDEFPGCPIERPGRLHELSRNGESHLRVPLWPEFYPSRNTAFVDVVRSCP